MFFRLWTLAPLTSIFAGLSFKFMPLPPPCNLKNRQGILRENTFQKGNIVHNSACIRGGHPSEKTYSSGIQEVWLPLSLKAKTARKSLRLLLRLNRALAERKGFEPLCAFAQTDFESAPLWPLRYLSVYVHPQKRGKQSLFNFLENPLDKPVRKIINHEKIQQNQGFSAVFGGTTTQMCTWFRVSPVMTASIPLRI